VYHLIFSGYLLALAVLLLASVLSLLLYSKYRTGSFRFFALYLGAAILILAADAVNAYDRAVTDDLSFVLVWVSAACSFLGSILVAFCLPRLSLALVHRPSQKLLRILDTLLLLPFGCIAAAARLWNLTILSVVWDLVFIGYHMHGVIVLIGGRGRIGHPTLLSFLDAVRWFAIPIAPILLAQPFLRLAPVIPAGYRDLSLPILLFFVGLASISLIYAVRNLFSPNVDPGINAYDEMIRRFGISRRECEILELLVHGRESKEIAGQLFISVNTVRNHVHNIYQKTGAKSKVQLINIIGKYNQ